MSRVQAQSEFFLRESLAGSADHPELMIIGKDVVQTRLEKIQHALARPHPEIDLAHVDLIQAFAFLLSPGGRLVVDRVSLDAKNILDRKAGAAIPVACDALAQYAPQVLEARPPLCRMPKRVPLRRRFGSNTVLP